MKAHQAPAHRCAVLIVEDDAELRELLSFALTTDGYAVSAVGNGREALRHLRSTPETCMILLDLASPVMDGRRFRAAQLRDRSLAWIPVIVISGGAEAAAQARELGARAVIRKPVDVDEMRRALRWVGCCHALPRPEHRAEAADWRRSDASPKIESSER